MSLSLFSPSLPVAASGPALLIDLKELSRLLTRSSESLLRDVKAGRIPRPVRIGKSVRWRRTEIEDWIAAGCASKPRPG